MENEFCNAFATPMTVTQSTMLENETGPTQKPPKLMIKDNGQKVDIKDLSVDEKKKYKNEKMMDERLLEGFSWDKYCPDEEILKAKAFVAKIVEDSADDNSYWADSMKEHLKYLAERDAEKARMAKKKVEKQDDRDDDNSYYAERMKEHLKFLDERDKERRKDKNDEEEVRVIKKQDKEIPAFEIKKEADAEKMIYPTVEGMKAFEEETSEVKKFETKEDTEVKNSEIVQAEAAGL
ncbi:peptidyl-prolyl cis-trans isomerase 1-like [Helianthus annuus]|uniref:peptidyl-prolyl cis-trans isomerase 1-like n=1 Tax=Helianthus annuus TaxID=4232 RepID=UPI0016530A42|nr:peptidyl-prolyl cis-trans isomerase 1-like [Helianthus annuus]